MMQKFLIHSKFHFDNVAGHARLDPRRSAHKSRSESCDEHFQLRVTP